MTRGLTTALIDRSMQPEDSAIEVSHLGSNAKLVVIDSVWGHMGTERILCSFGSLD